jgi:hypothetical protein
MQALPIRREATDLSGTGECRQHAIPRQMEMKGAKKPDGGETSDSSRARCYGQVVEIILIDESFM